MRRVVVLGAGFSKAVANCPLADELFEWVKNDFRCEAHEKEKQEKREIERLFGRLEKPG